MATEWEQQHESEDERRFTEQGERFSEIQTDIKTIKENHLTHIQASMEVQTAKVAVIETNISWVMRLQWIMVTAVIGWALASVFK